MWTVTSWSETTLRPCPHVAGYLFLYNLACHPHQRFMTLEKMPLQNFAKSLLMQLHVDADNWGFAVPNVTVWNMFFCHICDLCSRWKLYGCSCKGFDTISCPDAFFLLVFIWPNSAPHTRRVTKDDVQDGYFPPPCHSMSEADSPSETLTWTHRQLRDGNCAWTFLDVLVIAPIIVWVISCLVEVTSRDGSLLWTTAI